MATAIGFIDVLLDGSLPAPSLTIVALKGALGFVLRRILTQDQGMASNEHPLDLPLTAARNARHEAQMLVGKEWEARVLEPSPPAVLDQAWFADDPVAVDTASAAPLLPTGIGETAWTTWLADQAEHQEHATWVQQRWLGGDRTLPAVPTDLAATRVDLHRLAVYVMAPARHAVTGKFGLRWTLGGFGTPFFGTDRQIRVVGHQLVDQVGDATRVSSITTLRAAAEFLAAEIDSETAAEHDSPRLGDVDESLTVERAAVDFLDGWYGMAFAALEAVRADPASVDPSRPQLWPGHFDPAIEVGNDDHRGSYGASPGDASIDEPYLYVSLWWPDRIGVDPSEPIWNAPSFTGAVLKFSDFGDGDPVTRAVEFFSTIRDTVDAA